MRILTIIGARPTFVKHAVLSPEIRKRADEIVVHTGQHYDAEMNDAFFKDLGISAPDYNLYVGSKTHAQQTAWIMTGAEQIMMHLNPDVVLVYGDTNSALAGALAAAKINTPVAHVEAGLRSGDHTMPEEVNRIIIDHVSSYLFAPTYEAVRNLNHEGIRSGVTYTGDVTADAIANVRKNVVLTERDDKPCLLTIHRPSNTDTKEVLSGILDALGRTGKTILFPAHPRTQKAIERYGIVLPANIHIIKPVGYIESLNYIQTAEKLITDSGGMQKEAYILGVPCVTLRDTTEWGDTLHGGCNKLAGSDPEAIYNLVMSDMPRGFANRWFPTGACKKIATMLCGE